MQDTNNNNNRKEDQGNEIEYDPVEDRENPFVKNEEQTQQTQSFTLDNNINQPQGSFFGEGNVLKQRQTYTVPYQQPKPQESYDESSINRTGNTENMFANGGSRSEKTEKLLTKCKKIFVSIITIVALFMVTTLIINIESQSDRNTRLINNLISNGVTRLYFNDQFTPWIWDNNRDYILDKNNRCQTLDFKYRSKMVDGGKDIVPLSGIYTKGYIMENVTQLFDSLLHMYKKIEEKTDYICTFHLKYDPVYHKDGQNYHDKTGINLPCACIWKIKNDTDDKYLKIVNIHSISESNSTVEIEEEHFLYKDDASKNVKRKIPEKMNITVHDWESGILNMEIDFVDVAYATNILLDWNLKKIF